MQNLTWQHQLGRLREKQINIMLAASQAVGEIDGLAEVLLQTSKLEDVVAPSKRRKLLNGPFRKGSMANVLEGILVHKGKMLTLDIWKQAEVKVGSTIARSTITSALARLKKTGRIIRLDNGRRWKYNKAGLNG